METLTQIQKTKAQVRFTNGYVVILCNLGHLIESYKLDDKFGGSNLESELVSRYDGDRFDRLSSKCLGHGH